MRVLIVDDISVYRQALAGVLGQEPSIEAVETAADTHAALSRLGDHVGPWVVLLNMTMVDSTSVLCTMVRAAPDALVIALAVSEAEHEVVAYAEAGVAGYLLRRDSLVDLIAVIASVAQGEARCPPRIAAALLRRVATLSTEFQLRTVPTHLTSREREVLQLVDDGLSNKQIARRLSIELRTVKNHVHHILEKFQVHRRAEAAALFRAVHQHRPARTPGTDPDRTSTGTTGRQDRAVPPGPVTPAKSTGP
jgi:two-component system nitrate/nitrite response regulator NarL